MKTNKKNFTLKSCKKPYIVFSILYLIQIIPLLWLSENHPSYIDAAFIIFCAWGFTYIWLATFKIKIKNEELTYRTLLGGTKKIKIKNIKYIKHHTGREHFLSILEPYCKVVIIDKGKKPLLIINENVFEYEKLNKLMDDLIG